MAVLVSGNVYRISVRWLYNLTDEQVNVWHFQVGSGVAPTDSEQLADLEEAIIELYGDIPGSMVDELVHRDVTLFNITTSSPGVPLGPITELDGTAGDDPLPTGVSAFIWAKTNRARTIGRKFLPTFGESLVTNGLWTSVATDKLVLLGNRWQVGYEATNGTDFLWGVYGEAGGFRLPIYTNYSPVPAYQRRRKLGVGR